MHVTSNSYVSWPHCLTSLARLSTTSQSNHQTSRRVKTCDQRGKAFIPSNALLVNLEPPFNRSLVILVCTPRGLESLTFHTLAIRSCTHRRNTRYEDFVGSGLHRIADFCRSAIPGPDLHERPAARLQCLQYLLIPTDAYKQCVVRGRIWHKGRHSVPKPCTCPH